jgi:putative transposase
MDERSCRTATPGCPPGVMPYFVVGRTAFPPATSQGQSGVAVLHQTCYRFSTKPMEYYARHLPHWNPGGRTIFLTWRLYGSLPADVIIKLKQQRSTSAGRDFLKADRALDKTRSGPFWLNEPNIAACVVAALYRGQRELQQYLLRAFAVMPNHVHVLLDPSVSLDRITNGLKGVTAREANKFLGRTGQHFWQDESFDRWIRNGAQFDRIRMYIEHNPVTAGLVKNPEDWPWSSASRTATLGCP